MPPGRDAFLEALMQRARAAALEADLQGGRARDVARGSEDACRRARLLRSFVVALRHDPLRLPRRCAWCERIDVDGEFVAPEEFLDGDLPERLQQRATHGICPDCFARVRRELGRRPA